MMLLTKRVGKSIPLFEGRVNCVTNSLSDTSKNVITLKTLVMCSKELLFALTGKKLLINVEKDAERVQAAFEAIISPFEEYWTHVLEDESPDPEVQPNAAGYLRQMYVFPQGIGWQAVAQAAAQLISEYGDSWVDVFQAAVRDIDWRRENKEWEGRAVIYKVNKDGLPENTGQQHRARRVGHRRLHRPEGARDEGGQAHPRVVLASVAIGAALTWLVQSLLEAGLLERG
jgi:DNA sulfur modification protein DndB